MGEEIWKWFKSEMWPSWMCTLNLGKNGRGKMAHGYILCLEGDSINYFDIWSVPMNKVSGLLAAHMVGDYGAWIRISVGGIGQKGQGAIKRD